MKKEIQLREALTKLLSEAGRQNLTIQKIALPPYWLELGEVPPDKLLGVEINNF